MRLLSIALRSTFVLTLAPLAAAQGPFDPGGIHRAPIDEEAGGTPKFVATAQVSADLKPDAVLFGNGACIFAFGPAAYDSHSYPEPNAPASISSWVRVPGAASGNTERFLGTSSNALFLMSRTGGDLEITNLGISGWTNAGKIQVADINQDSYLDVIGHASTSGGLFKVVFSIFASPSSVYSFEMPTGEQVRDWVLMNWDTSGNLDMIVWCDKAGDSRVVNWNPATGGTTVVYDRTFVPPAGNLLALDYPGSEQDRVAILFKAPTGTSWMLATAWNGGNDERTLLPAAEIVGAAAACLGGAGDVYPDILITNKQAVVRIFPNSGSTEAFSTPLSTTYSLLESGTSFDQVGRPALDDLDNDGDLDLLCTVEASVGEYELVVLPGAFENRFDESPKIDALETSYLHDSTLTPPITLDLQIDRGTAHDMPNVDGLELVVWAVEADIESPADPTPIVSGIFAVGSNWDEVLVNLELPVSLASGLYALEVREVDRDTSGKVVAAGPSVAWILHSEGLADDVELLYPPVGGTGSVSLMQLPNSGNVIINVLPTLYVPPFTDADYVDDPSTSVWPY